MRMCSVPNCGTTSATDPNLMFYSLPISQRGQQKWLQMTKLDPKLYLLKSIYVCSLHFPGGMKTYRCYYPSIFPWSEEWPTVLETYNTNYFFEDEDPVEQQSPKARRWTTQLYFRSQHSNHWLEFDHENSPALSCMANYKEQERAITSDSGNDSRVHLQTLDTLPKLVPSSEKDDDSDDEDPAALLSAGKGPQLMRLLQKYRDKNKTPNKHQSFPGKLEDKSRPCPEDAMCRLPELRNNGTLSTLSEEHQSFPGKREKEPVSTGMEDKVNDRNVEGQMISSPLSPGELEFEGFSPKDMDFAKAAVRSLRKAEIKQELEVDIIGIKQESQPTDLQDVFIKKRKRRLLEDPTSFTIEGVTYMKVLKVPEEDHLAECITKEIFATKCCMSRRKTGNYVYNFCKKSNINVPTVWDIIQSADEEWLKGFFRRYPVLYSYANLSEPDSLVLYKDGKDEKSYTKNNKSSSEVKDKKGTCNKSKNVNSSEVRRKESDCNKSNSESSLKGEVSKFIIHVIPVVREVNVRISPLAVVKEDHNYSAESKRKCLI